MIVAVLHDMLEDAEVTTDHLEREGFGQDVIQALQCLTKVEDESYPDFVKCVSTNQLARCVTLLDLADMKRFTDAITYLRIDTSE